MLTFHQDKCQDDLTVHHFARTAALRCLCVLGTADVRVLTLPTSARRKPCTSMAYIITKTRKRVKAKRVARPACALCDCAFLTYL